MMTTVGVSQFCLIGQFISFLPGEKSPYQGISLEVFQGDDRSSIVSTVGSNAGSHLSKAAELAVRQVVLSKRLRRMMYCYLAPRDWVRVVGKPVFDKRSGQVTWKATEISKLPAHQVDRLTHQMRLSTQAQALVSEASSRVLVCQGASCRRRGSSAVGDAIAHLLSEKESPLHCAVQPTGCMKRCKQGPNVVFPSGGSYDPVTVEQVRALIPHRRDVEL